MQDGPKTDYQSKNRKRSETKMNIRNAKIEDLDEILKIYSYARTYMAENGNPTQWSDGYPKKEMLLNDIVQNNLYVGYDDTGIHFVFAFIIGRDKCYEYIENGSWINEEKYGTIHRIAKDEQTKNIFPSALSFCTSKISNIRIDTHHDNKIMQHIIEKNGFTKCGIVYMEDKTPRIAYQKCIESTDSK